MSFEVVLLSRAQRDFDTIINWLSANSPAALNRWFDSYEKILDRLEREPLSFGFAPGMKFYFLRFGRQFSELAKVLFIDCFLWLSGNRFVSYIFEGRDKTL